MFDDARAMLDREAFVDLCCNRGAGKTHEEGHSSRAQFNQGHLFFECGAAGDCSFRFLGRFGDDHFGSVAIEVKFRLSPW
jgi:hypothetical protein